MQSVHQPEQPAPKLARYVVLGAIAALSYVSFDLLAESKIRDGTLHGALASAHAVIDKVLPLVAGVLLGILIHHRRVRSRLSAHQELAVRAEALRQRLLKVERDQAVWVLAAAVLHELNNPLHALGLLLDEHADSEGDDARQAELGRRARAQMDRVRAQLAQLRAMRSAGAPELRPVAVDRVATLLADDLTCLPENDAFEVRVQTDGPLLVHGDPTYLRTILENLLDNSLRALRERGKGSVTIQLGREQEHAVVRICDTGPPLSPALRASLFEPLRPQKTQGLGLGLPIARALARAMNGELSYEDASGKSFRLELPLAVGS
ncbi:MAG TPA: HAMP domain-containing sensor histidine kinase [Polyangiaceae bacterium]|nr:HAMP domain-containing sensor histidine kinase [Polyangiaceae bacterium]